VWGKFRHILVLVFKNLLFFMYCILIYYLEKAPEGEEIKKEERACSRGKRECSRSRFYRPEEVGGSGEGGGEGDQEQDGDAQGEV
jgi:hypothetical protein